VNKDEVITNLYSCVDRSTKSYKLNAEAFTHHVSNFRQEIIEAIFARCGIANLSILMRGVEKIKEYLTQVHGARDCSQLKSSELFPVLSDLANRRNEVAHGTVNDLLSNEILVSYMDFLELYAEVLSEVVIEQAIQFEVKYQGVYWGRPIDVFNNCIVGLNVPIKESVGIGDVLVAKTPDERFLWGGIVEIQINRQALTCVSAIQPLQIALRVEYHAKPNQEFFVLRRTS
jgi:RiboL-PSP-HEPN